MAKTYVIDGKEYVEVARRADIGEKIIITKHPNEPAYHGNIYKVTSIPDKGKVSAEGLIAITSHDVFYHGEYRVLVEVDVESPDVTDLLANLARRVTSLESQLRDTQRNLETFAEQTERNTIDIAMLDNRTYSLTTVQSADGILNEIERLLKRRSDCR
jgi:hypothetical protein